MHIAPNLKEQCHEICDFSFFSCLSFPQATEYTIGAYGKFNAGVLDTGGNGKLPPVSLTPVANLAPISRISAVLVEKFATGVVNTVVDAGGKFDAGVVDTGGKFEAINLMTLSF
jgi:hypothetical protein